MAETVEINAPADKVWEVIKDFDGIARWNPALSKSEGTSTPAGAGSKLEWKSRLYRGDTGNEPPEDLNDEAAVKATQNLFRAGLDELKKRLESGH